MSVIKLVAGFLVALTCKAFCQTASPHAFRKDWPDCCRDSDARRAAVESMRDECRRVGF